MNAFLNRRNMLIGLAASAGAASAAQAATEAQELPELLALADKMPPAIARYTAALKQLAAIEKEWMPHWPTPHDEAILFGHGEPTHTDIRGRGLQIPYLTGLRVVEVGRPQTFRIKALIDRHEAERRSKFKSQRGMKNHVRWAEQAEEAEAHSKRYWSERERIVKASGIEAAEAERKEAYNALFAVVDAIMGAEEKTILGLTIKAQALHSWNEVTPHIGKLEMRAPVWASQMAESVMRFAA